MVLKIYKLKVLILSVFLIIPFIMMAQVPPGWDYASTPSSEIIAIDLGVNPTIDGVAIEPGDYIGVFFDDEGVLKCGGNVEWDGSVNVSISAYGNDNFTGEKDGFYPNEWINWKIYSQAEETEYEATATFQTQEECGTCCVFDNYWSNCGFIGLAALSTLEATTGVNYTISGTLTDAVSDDGINQVLVTFTDDVDDVFTDASGFYTQSVPEGWAGTVEPTNDCYTFDPLSIAYTEGVFADQTDQDYTGTLFTYDISGTVLDDLGNPLVGVTLTITDLSPVLTDENGDYTFEVGCGWTGSVTPTLFCYGFDPASIAFSDVKADFTGQDFEGAIDTFYDITGLITYGEMPIEGVLVTFDGGITATTGSDGFYTASVPCHYTGDATPTHGCYTFDPVSRSYENVENGFSDEDYLGEPSSTYTISGFVSEDGEVGIEGVEIDFTGLGTVATDEAGEYSIIVPCGYTGTSTPSHGCYDFTPAFYEYVDLMVDMPDQDFTGEIADFFTITGNVYNDEGPIEGAAVDFDALGIVYSDVNGDYTQTVPCGYSGSSVVDYECYDFTPGGYTYANVTAHITDQDFDGALIYVVVSGTIANGGPIAGVNVDFDGLGSTDTDGSGFYSYAVPCGWIGDVTPTKTCYTFDPSFTTVTALDNVEGVDFVGTLLGPYAISGYIFDEELNPVPGVVVTYEALDDVFTNESGFYTYSVPCGWSGEVVPSHDCYSFDPLGIEYVDVMAPYGEQDYTATELGPYTVSGQVSTIATGTGIPNVEVVISGMTSEFTDANGDYSFEVPCGWNGTVTPELLTWIFNPLTITFTNVIADMPDQDFVGTQETFTISGVVTDGVGFLTGATVSMSGSAGSAVTDANGYYEIDVFAGFTGISVCAYDGYYFTPASWSYTNLNSDFADQDFVGTETTLPPGWGPITITPTTHLISVPLDADPNIDDIPLSPGDYIGVFYDDAGTLKCGGAVMWNGVSPVAVQAYGDDGTTPEKDGFYEDEPFTWMVYSWMAADEYEAEVTYDPNLLSDGLWHANGLSALMSLDADGETYVISGMITGSPGIEGVTVQFDNGGGFAVTDGTGAYSQTLLKGWSGTATPFKTGYHFMPVSVAYAPLTADMADEDYEGELNEYFISGFVTDDSGDPLGGVMVFFNNGGGTATTLGSGFYGISVLFGYTGTAYPQLDGYAFAPETRSYIGVSENITDENYVGTYSNFPPIWDPPVQTPVSHVISAPLESMPNINGCDLLPGDFIGVFFDDEGVLKCGGAVEWNGTSNVAVLAYGDDIYTDDKDGFVELEPFTWRIYSAVTGLDYEAEATYNPGLLSDGLWYAFGLSAFTSLDGTTEDLYTISGTITDFDSGLGLEGVEVTFTDLGSVFTDVDGFYSIDVLFGYSGTATPYMVRYDFDPLTIDYSCVMTDMPDEDYVGTYLPCPPGWCPIPITPGTHIISVPLGANPRIDGQAIVPGDFVGVFYLNDAGDAEVCGGYAEWTGVGAVAVVAYGDDATTTEKDGFTEGEYLRWKVYSWDYGAEYEAIAVYDETQPNFDGKFYVDGLSALLDLYADPLVVIATADPNPICYDGGTQLSSIATGGSGFYTYEWVPAANLNNPNISNPYASNLLETTIFTVEVNTFVNTAFDDVTVTVFDELLVSIAEDQIICYNTVPLELTSVVSGGDEDYTYQWQESPDDATWTDIAGATDATYQPEALMVTTYYQLMVDDAHGCGVVTSNSVMIFVYDEFLATIAEDQTICFNTIPELLTSTVTGGQGDYTYQWQEFEGGTWVDLSLGADGPTFQPPALLATKEYRLWVVDLCGEIFTEEVTITVYQEFTATIAEDQIICFGDAPEALTSDVNGGMGDYVYQWQISTDGTTYTDIEDATDDTYQPEILFGQTWYRLDVVDYCGEIFTDPVIITIYDDLVASIAADQTICYNTVPEELTSTVTGGKGDYTYQWEMKEGDEWVYIADATGPTYQPPALTISKEYRLHVVDFCEEIDTEPVLITVYEDLMASIAADQTICFGDAPEALTSTVSGGMGDYAYQWQISSDGVEFTDIEGATDDTYQPETLFGQTWYRLHLTDFCGEIYTEPVVITIYDDLVASIAADQTICYNTVPDELTSVVTGGKGDYTYQWEKKEGDEWVYIADATGPTYQPPALLISMYYRLHVVDFCEEIDTEPVLITVYEDLMAGIAADQTICYNTIPEMLTSTVSGGMGDYTYQWQVYDGEGYTDIEGAIEATYQPGALMVTTTYRLIVTDFCGVITTEDVTITVYDDLMASIAMDQSICWGTAPEELTSVVSGGAGNYDYQWQIWNSVPTMVYGELSYNQPDLDNPYLYSYNSWTEAGWTAANVSPDDNHEVSGVTVTADMLCTDSWWGEVELWLESPAGTIVKLWEGFESYGCTENFVLETNAFDGETSEGEWLIYFTDSYGDGGGTAYGVTFTFGYWYEVAGGWIDIAGATAATYQPGELFETTLYRLAVADDCGDIFSNELTISVTPLPEAYAGEDVEICENDSYTLEGSAVNYSSTMWTTSGDGTFDDAASLGAVYTPGEGDIDLGYADLTLTAYPMDPCTDPATDMMSIYFAPLPTVSAGDDGVVCEGDSYMTLGFTINAWTVYWTTAGDGTFSDPNSTLSFYTPGPGDIANGSVVLTFTATSIPPCTDEVSDSMVLTIENLPSADAGSNASICEDESYTLDGDASNYSSTMWTTSGDGYFNNAGWLDATYTPGDDDIANGSATLTLTAYGNAPCDVPATDDMILYIQALPDVYAGADAAVCEGQYYTMADASATDYASVMWTTSGSGQFDNPAVVNPVYLPSAGDLADGSVTLTLTGYAEEPCAGMDSDAMTLSFSLLPFADAGADDAVCGIEEYTLDGYAEDYVSVEWTTSGDGTFDDNSILDATYTPGAGDIAAGSAELTLTAYAAEPCTEDAVDAMVLGVIAPPTAYAGEDDKICENETYTLSGEAENFDYTVWTTSGDGTFDNNTLLDATYYPGPNDILVGYADLTLSAYPFKPCIEPASDQMTLSIDRLPDVPGTPTGLDVVCVVTMPMNDYETVGTPNALSYQWAIFPEDAGYIEGEGTIGTVHWTGTYFGPVLITVQGINECGGGEFSEPIEVYADPCVGTPSVYALDVNLYPNPSDGRFNLELSGVTEKMDMFIMDYAGQLLFQDKIESDTGEYLRHIDISTYPKGVYFIKLVG